MKLEMYTTTNGRDIIVDYGDKQTVIHENDPLIDKLWSWIKNKYPLAAIWLNEQYDTTYEMTLRFLKCNFSIKDNVPDIINDQWNLEFVPCPMRGECSDENIICNAKLDCGISLREKQVLELIAQGKSSKQIAEKLFISPLTVDTHRKNMLERLELHSIGQLITFAHQNHIL